MLMKVGTLSLHPILRLLMPHFYAGLGWIDQSETSHEQDQKIDRTGVQKSSNIFSTKILKYLFDETDRANICWSLDLYFKISHN